jgi:uncharacterized protein involved in cysteine biosynthesis
MIPAFSAALRQLGDPPIRRVIWRVALWTGLVFALLGWGLWAAVAGFIDGFDPSTSFDFIPIEWLRDSVIWMVGLLVALVGGFVFLAMFWLLFAAIVQFVASFYLDRVAAAVEARHYPDLPAPGGLKIGEAISASLRFFATLVVFNLLLVPVYLIPGIGILAFYLLNGYLMGREYFEIIAARRSDHHGLRALRQSSRGRLLVAGLIITVLLSVPVVNLVAPIVAAAAMVHIYQGIAARHATELART